MTTHNFTERRSAEIPLVAASTPVTLKLRDGTISHTTVGRADWVMRDFPTDIVAYCFAEQPATATTTPMACGNCGNGLFRIRRAGDALHAECTSCACVSVITTRPAELQIDWGENAHGILCDMTPSMEQVTPPEPPAPEQPAPPPPPPICKPGQCKWQDNPNGSSTCTTCSDWPPF